jgi:hypothetical protein
MFLFSEEKKNRRIYINHLCCYFCFEIIVRMIRTIVRYLTTKIPNNPKPLAPHKPKASIDFVSNEDKMESYIGNIFHIG